MYYICRNIFKKIIKHNSNAENKFTLPFKQCCHLVVQNESYCNLNFYLALNRKMSIERSLYHWSVIVSKIFFETKLINLSPRVSLANHGNFRNVLSDKLEIIGNFNWKIVASFSAFTLFWIDGGIKANCQSISKQRTTRISLKKLGWENLSLVKVMLQFYPKNKQNLNFTYITHGNPWRWSDDQIFIWRHSARPLIATCTPVA